MTIGYDAWFGRILQWGLRRTFVAAAMVLVAGCLTACVVIPLPPPRGELSEQELYSIGMGSTRAEVEVLLGVPNVYGDERYSVYSLYRAGNRVLWFVTFAGVGEGGVEHQDAVHYNMLFEYDADGVVIRHDIKTTKPPAEDEAVLDEVEQLLLLTRKGSFGEGALGRTGHYDSVAISPDGTLLAAASTRSRRVHVWSLDGNQDKPIYEFKTGGCGNPCQQVFVLAFSHDGTRLASTGFEDGVRIWSVETGKALLTLSGHEKGLAARTSVFAFSPDDTIIATGGNRGRHVIIRDAFTGKELRWRSSSSLGSRFPFAPDGRTLALLTHDDGPRITLHSIETGEEVADPDRVSGASSATFSGNGRLLAVATSVHLEFWHTGEMSVDAPVSELDLFGELVNIEVLPPATPYFFPSDMQEPLFSPDSRWLASLQGSFVVWDAATGAKLLDCKCMFAAAAFHPDGRSLVTVGKGITVWEIS